MARHPSVDITDTTPAHTAATLRPDRHHTHGLHTTISGWRLHEPYTLQSFCMNSSCPGRSLSANYSLPHAPCAPLCGKLSGVAWQERPTARVGVRSKPQTSCFFLRHPTTSENEERALVPSRRGRVPFGLWLSVWRWATARPNFVYV